MHSRFIGALLIVALAAAAEAPRARTAATDLVVTAGERLHAGDVIRIQGKGAFVRGTRHSFFVGGEYASWRRLDDDSAVLVVPAGVAPGQRWLSYTPRLTTSAEDAIGIARLDVQPEQTTTIAAATAVLPSDTTTTVVAGVMRIEGRGIKRPATVTLRQVRADAENAFFRSTILAGFDRPDPPLPPLSFDDVFVIETGQGAQLFTLAITIPAEWLRTLPAGHEPELYVYTEQHGANDEVIPEVHPLGARWTASTRELRARPAAPLRAAPHQEMTVYLGIRRKEHSK